VAARKPHHHRSRKRPASPVPAGDGKISVWVSRPGIEKCEHIAPDRISEIIQGPDVIVWVDVDNPGEAELKVLQEEFGFHRLALEDVAKGMQRPKVDEYPDYFFVVLYAPLSQGDEHALETTEIDLFVGRNFVVTCHRGTIPSLEEGVRRWERTEPELRKHVGMLLHVIADTVIDAYFPIVDQIEDRLDDLELSMFRGQSGFDPEELIAVKRSLYTLRKAIYPLREVFNVFLRRDQMIFSSETYPYFQDAYDHVLRLLDIIDIERDMATGALEAQLSIVSNRLNETMKRLTVIAICVGVMGAVFGAWGMNFTQVPLDQLGLAGFFLVFGTTLILVAIVLAVAKRYGAW
jgi:magnesium transporter